MFTLFLLGVFFLGYFYNSSNPLSSALSFLFSLLLISPVLSTMNTPLYVFIFLLVFSSGILVLSVYFCSLVAYVYTPTIGTLFLVCTCVGSFPLVLSFPTTVSTSLFLINQFWWLICYLVTKIVGFLLLSSYMTSSKSSARRN